MDFTKFIAGYKTSKDTGAYVQKRITKQYLPYTTKLSLALSIAKNCTHITMGEKEIYKKDTPSQYFTTIMQLVQQYTDITFDSATVTKAYDGLMECGALNVILASIPESEITEFRTLIDMCISDIYENERDLTSFIETKLEAVNLTTVQMLDSLKELIPQIKQASDENKDKDDNEDFPMNKAED